MKYHFPLFVLILAYTILPCSVVPCCGGWHAWASEAAESSPPSVIAAVAERPAEVNLGVKFIEHGGKQVIWALNGLPDRTDGWQRWEWRITTDPRMAHGVFSILLIGLPLAGTRYR